MCSTSSWGVGALPSKTITDATCMCAVESSSRCRNAESSADRRSGLLIASIVAASVPHVNVGGLQPVSRATRNLENSFHGDQSSVTPVTDNPRKAVSYTHLRAHETGRNLVCRL